MNNKDELISSCAHAAAIEDHKNKQIITKEKLEKAKKLNDPKARMLGTKDEEHSDVGYDTGITPERHNLKNIVESAKNDLHESFSIYLSITDLSDLVDDETRDIIKELESAHKYLYEDVIGSVDNAIDTQYPNGCGLGTIEEFLKTSPVVKEWLDKYHTMVYDDMEEPDEYMNEGFGTALAAGAKFIGSHWKEILSALEAIGVTASAINEIAKKAKVEVPATMNKDGANATKMDLDESLFE